MPLSAAIAEFWQNLSGRDLPRSHCTPGETPSHVCAQEQCVLPTAGRAKAPARGGEPHEREHQTRGYAAEDRRDLSEQEGPAARIALGSQSGEAGLPVLRQRRSRAVVQEATRRPLPRLLQAALRFGRATQEGCAHWEDEGREVVSRRETNLIGAGPLNGSGPRSSWGSGSADGERLFLRAPEQREIHPARETDNGEVGWLAAFGKCLHKQLAVSAVEDRGPPD
jgi:hypothetical protein